ncbi:MAG: hypothetical protein C0507_13050 [Cyanobacteria bacterium PR.3.49]|nr:hypothetical protein [Cyanobacteria bacterium PR.3.49]
MQREKRAAPQVSPFFFGEQRKRFSSEKSFFLETRNFEGFSYCFSYYGLPNFNIHSIYTINQK